MESGSSRREKARVGKRNRYFEVFHKTARDVQEGGEINLLKGVRNDETDS